MKTIYIKQKGKKVTITVSDEQYELMTNLRREQWRNNKNFRNHNCSFEQKEEQEYDFSDESQNPETSFINYIDKEQNALYLKKLRQGLKILSEKQASAIYMHFFLDMGITEIAEDEGVAKQTIDERIQSALKKLKKLF